MFSRFAKYLERTWDFDKVIARIKDTRPYPRIPTSATFLSLFGMFSLRLGSFNELDQQLKIPKRWDALVGECKPSTEAIEYCLERFDLDAFRDMQAVVAHQFKRKKVFTRRYPDVHWVGAIDGIETYKSRKRCCPQCCTRKIQVGEKTVTEYYHRYVVFQLVGVVPALIMDAEPILPGETETTAGIRLLERVKKRHPRFIDVIALEAFYLQAPFVLKALELGYGLVIVLKQENRDLYQDAEELFKIDKAKTIHGVSKTAEVWDLEGLTSWSQLGKPVRVVRSLETEILRERIAGNWTERRIQEDWRWAVIFPDGRKPETDLVGQWGHARWDQETQGFGELTQHWHINHCYHHHPRAMLACLLILFLAFILSTVFFQRNLKPPVRKGKTRIHLASLLADDLIRGGLESFWNHPP